MAPARLAAELPARASSEEAAVWAMPRGLRCAHAGGSSRACRAGGLADQSGGARFGTAGGIGGGRGGAAVDCAVLVAVERADWAAPRTASVPTSWALALPLPVTLPEPFRLR
jgi:hypothetical protein